MNIYNTTEFSKLTGVDRIRLWRWHKDGKFKGRISPSGVRFYTDVEYKKLMEGVQDEREQEGVLRNNTSDS